MLIIGAKGFAKEVLEIFHQKSELEGLAFFDDVNNDIGDLLYQKFPILKNEEQVLKHFKIYGNDFVIGIGNPLLRYKMAKKISKIGGNLKSSISKYACVGSYGVVVNEGVNILSNSLISNNVTIGKGSLIYYNSTIAHDSYLGEFVEVSPSVSILGNVKVGSFSQIGSNATILPNITIGENVIIAAGAVVTKDVPPNVLVAGVPAKVIKEIV